MPLTASAPHWLGEATGTPNNTLVVYCGGTGEVAGAYWTAPDGKSLLRAPVAAAGYAVISPDCSDYSSPASVDNVDAAIVYAFSTLTYLERVVMLSQSMGGPTGLMALTTYSDFPIDVWAGIYPIVDRQAYPGSPGPPEYPRPLYFPPTDYDGKWMRFYASPDDTLVPKVQHTDPMNTAVTGHAHEDGARVVVCSGNHGDVSHFQPTDLIAFYDRATLSPVAYVAVAPDTGTVPVTVTADASMSTTPVGTIASYTFDFGDGTTVGPQTGATATHTYTTPGTYTVALTVVTSGSLTGSASSSPVTVTGTVGATTGRIRLG